MITFFVLARQGHARCRWARGGRRNERDAQPVAPTIACRCSAAALINKIALALSLVAMAIGLAALIWILFDALWLGAQCLAPTLFIRTPLRRAAPAGLRNAIVGTRRMVRAGDAVGTPIGVLAGIYLAEYGRAAGSAARRAS